MDPSASPFRPPSPSDPSVNHKDDVVPMSISPPAATAAAEAEAPAVDSKEETLFSTTTANRKRSVSNVLSSEPQTLPFVRRVSPRTSLPSSPSSSFSSAMTVNQDINELLTSCASSLIPPTLWIESNRIENPHVCCADDVDGGMKVEHGVTCITMEPTTNVPSPSKSFVSYELSPHLATDPKCISPSISSSVHSTSRKLVGGQRLSPSPYSSLPANRNTKHQEDARGKMEHHESGIGTEIAREQDLPPWSYGHHRDFVSAILSMGIRRVSPAIIKENMVANPASLNGDKMKSHLQKFRQSQHTEVSTFMNEYDDYLVKLLQSEDESDCGLGTTMEKLLVGGRAAAALTYEVLHGRPVVAPLRGHRKNTVATSVPDRCKPRYTTDDRGYPIAVVPKQELTDEEMESSLGKALCCVHGAIEQMSKFVLAERTAAAQAAKAASERKAALERDPVDAALSEEFAFVNVGLDLDGKPLRDRVKTACTGSATPRTKTTQLIRRTPTKLSPQRRIKDPSKVKSRQKGGGRTKTVSNLPPSIPLIVSSSSHARLQADNAPNRRNKGEKSSSMACAPFPIVNERHASPHTMIAELSTLDEALFGIDEEAQPPRRGSPSSLSTTPSALHKPCSSPNLPPIMSHEAYKFALPPPAPMLSANHVSMNSMVNLNEMHCGSRYQAEERGDTYDDAFLEDYEHGLVFWDGSPGAAPCSDIPLFQLEASNATSGTADLSAVDKGKLIVMDAEECVSESSPAK